MEVKYKDTFFESLKKLARRETWWYKIWETIRWDIPRFFSNIWKFRKELYAFYAWDSSYQIAMFRKGLELNANYLEEHGLEVEGSRMKKVAKIRRAVEIMGWHENDDFLELAEKELGYEYRIGDFRFEKVEGETFDNPMGEDGEDLFEMFNDLDEETERINKLISDRSIEIGNATWKELFEILQGQEHEEFTEIYKKVSGDGKDNEDLYDRWFSGAGLKTWWD